jgi:hypothetical protein
MANTCNLALTAQVCPHVTTNIHTPLGHFLCALREIITPPLFAFTFCPPFTMKSNTNEQ